MTLKDGTNEPGGEIAAVLQSLQGGEVDYVQFGHRRTDGATLVTIVTSLGAKLYYGGGDPVLLTKATLYALSVLRTGDYALIRQLIADNRSMADRRPYAGGRGLPSDGAEQTDW
jgi:hypothetical protein